MKSKIYIADISFMIIILKNENYIKGKIHILYSLYDLLLNRFFRNNLKNEISLILKNLLPYSIFYPQSHKEVEEFTTKLIPNIKYHDSWFITWIKIIQQFHDVTIITSLPEKREFYLGNNIDSILFKRGII